MTRISGARRRRLDRPGPAGPTDARRDNLEAPLVAVLLHAVNVHRARRASSAGPVTSPAVAAEVEASLLYSARMAVIDLRSDTVTKPTAAMRRRDGRRRGRRRRLGRGPDGQRAGGASGGAPRQGGRALRRVRDDGQPRGARWPTSRAARRSSPAARPTSSSTRRPATRSSSVRRSASSATAPMGRSTSTSSRRRSAIRLTSTSRRRASSSSRTPTATR